MNGNFDMSAEQLDRLVDGELSSIDRQKLIREIQAGGHWKLCALAFLEAQAFHEEIHGEATPARESPTLASPTLASATLPIPAAAESPDDVGNSRTPNAPLKAFVEPKRRADGHRSAKPKFMASIPWWVGIAASVIIAFTLGRRFEESGTAVLQGGVDAVPQIGQSGPMDSGLAAAGHPMEPIFWHGESMVPPGVESELRRLGREIRREVGFASVWDADGNRGIVPYEDVQVVPVADRAY